MLILNFLKRTDQNSQRKSEFQIISVANMTSQKKKKNSLKFSFMFMWHKNLKVYVKFSSYKRLLQTHIAFYPKAEASTPLVISSPLLALLSVANGAQRNARSRALISRRSFDSEWLCPDYWFDIACYRDRVDYDYVSLVIDYILVTWR